MQLTFSLRSLAFVLLVLATFALGACGQRGPLYLPDEQKSSRNDLKTDNRAPSTINDATNRHSTNQQ